MKVYRIKDKVTGKFVKRIYGWYSGPNNVKVDNTGDFSDSLRKVKHYRY